MNMSNKNKDDEEEEYNSEDESISLSKKKLKKISRLSIADLKQLTKRPEVVEWVDATASDPGLLLTLKSHRNTVPVPAHWSQKRKYLQGKRGIEKPPFELPDFIKDTGIMEMRAAAKDKEDSSKLKTKARERMQPKMGKLDIDYQRLHDAFFRFQTKPRLTRHGELYFEGKEFEAKLKEKKPGQLSEELKAALNIPPLAPPPWLINMQRFGPPPSYPNLKIPGLNCPIPHGANWGYHPGGWGKPPVDENNRPLYGDVFGINQFDYNDSNAADVNKELWGQVVSDEEYEEEEEEEAEEEEEEEAPAVEETEFHQPPPPTQENIAEGYATPSGYSSVQTGLQTPEFVELRKGRKFEEEPKQLYHVLPEMQAPITGSFGSQHVYNMEALNESSSKEPRKRRRFDVDVSLDPSELENPEAVEAKYNQAKTVSITHKIVDNY
jgi:splicing factor 3B subunit 2